MYSGAIDLSGSATSPVTIKAVTVRNGNASDVSTEVVTLTLPTPVITANGTAGTATITCGVAGATIYYTTNGSTPTTSSQQYTIGLTGLAVMSTIKAIAVKDGWNNSAIASTTVTIPSGISNGVVTLFDCEPHSWAYYSDEDCPVHQLNPADVKITYYGYGDATMTSSNTDQLPANSAFDQDVADTAVQVNKGEAGHTFVYFKTLENANDAGTGDYPYTMIPNPFQVRPTYESDWRGFYAWRVKSLSSGLSIKVGNTTYTSSDINSGIIIYAEQEVEFITSNAKGNAVEFEALWAKAYLNDDAQGHRYENSGDYRNAYERNFKKVTSLTTYGYPVTISSINPDGSGDVGSVTRTSNYDCSNDVKLENMTLNMSSYYINAAGKNLTIGRGVANGNNNVASNVYGYYTTSTNNQTIGTFTVRVESGKYAEGYVLYGSSGGTTNSAYNAKFIYGSDYERATSPNNPKPVFSGVVEVSHYFYSTNSSGNVGITVLSGSYGRDAADIEFYMGHEYGQTYNKLSTRSLEVYGGEFIGGIAGGIERGVDVSTNILDIRIRGGIIHRYFYGSGQFSAGTGNRRFVITGGTFDCWVAGGCYGTESSGGATNGNIDLYFGGDASQTNTDGIFGAGYGSAATSNNSYTVNYSNVVFADNATTTGSVYGGGNNGYAKNDIQVYLAGGTVAGNVFGGANRARSSANVAVTVTKGTVTGGVYGGSNQSGAISGTVTVDVYGTDPQPNSGYAINQVFGGGNVAAYDGTPAVTVHCGDNISIGELYGGGNAATVQGTNVVVEGGNRIGNVFGGCYGANVTTNGTKVNIKGGTIEHVYGGNNASGTITGAIRVRAHKDSDCPMKIGELYGGGNRAGSAAGSIDIGCTGTYVEGVGGHADCNESDNRIGYELEGIGDVFGGANRANISTGITLTIDSGMVYRVFGGNNNSGTIGGTITVNIQKTNPNTCGWYVGYVYGGGFNAAYSNAATNNPSVNVSAGLVSHSVFGGGKGDDADINGNPRVTLSGTARVGENVYGGGDAADVVGNTSVILKD
ncbi:MAG: chitobiase/beta-hexosaminidase C-terminal domain-containing protein [Bacteroidales bacterium]|nr:chitobiase/beta-hexosaminidase C-terminal domain-containing protein [Bacteroidales bacterium]